MILRPVLPAAAAFFVACLLGLVLPFAFVLAGLALVAVFIVGVNQFVKAGQGAYRYGSDTIQLTLSGLVDETEIEVRVDDIMTVEVHQNALQAWLFGTGTLRFQTVDRAEREVVLTDVDEPGVVFEKIRDTLDLPLDRDDPVEQSYSPAPSGVYSGAVLTLVGYGIAAAVAGAYIMAETASTTAGITTASLIGVIALIHTPFRVRNFLRTTYRLREQYIEVQSGFLTNTHQIMPRVNINDTDEVQGWIGGFLGLKSLQLRAPDIGGLVFYYLPDEAEITPKLHPKQNDAMKPSDKQSQSPDTESDHSTPGRTLRPGYHNSWLVGGLLMAILSAGLLAVPEPGRALLMLSLLGLFVGSGLTITGLFYPFTTTYRVTEDYLVETYQFVISSQSDIRPASVSRYTIEQSLIQRLLGTATLQVVSSGMQDNITIRGVKRATLQDALKAFRAEAGLKPEAPEAPDELQATGTTFTGLLTQSFIMPAAIIGAPIAVAGLFLFADLVVASAGMGALLIGAGGVYALGRYYHARCWRVVLDRTFLTFEYGLLARYRTMLPYRTNKSLSSSRPPFLSTGWLIVDHAGQVSGVFWPLLRYFVTFGGHRIDGSFAIPLVDDPEGIRGRLEAYMYDKPDWEQTDDRSTSESTEGQISPTPYYTLAGLFAFCFIAPGISALSIGLNIITFAISIGLCFMGLSMFAIAGIYAHFLHRGLTEKTVYTRYFVFVFHERHIRHGHINRFNRRRTLADKLFGTQSVEVSTIGSIQTDMQLTYLANGDELCDQLQA